MSSSLKFYGAILNISSKFIYFMNTKDFWTPHNLERCSFLWSEVRLLVAALTLILGTTPVIFLLLPISTLYSILRLGVAIAWLISGVSSAYLLYRWSMGNKMLFNGTDTKDRVAFLVSVISGLNLGIVGLLGTNIGMSISSDRVVLLIVAVLYIVSAVHLHKRWKGNGQKLFS